MADGARLYQILRGRLYERLPLLALALGLLDWREGEKTGTDGRFFYAPISFLEQAVRSPERTDSFSTRRYPFWQKRKQTAKRRSGRFFTACCMRCCCTRGSAGE